MTLSSTAAGQLGNAGDFRDLKKKGAFGCPGAAAGSRAGAMEPIVRVIVP